jgi:DNA-binding NarL/FixJ family response regulator
MLLESSRAKRAFRKKNKFALAVLDLTAEITSPTLQELQDLAPDCKLILWTNSIAADFALQALSIGIRGILRKTLPIEMCLQCLHENVGAAGSESPFVSSGQAFG